ncbi:MAG TPA: SDR family oxidoreductase [Ktedonobacterales bacterium]|nr:SDR family oxidoreductase [Ktedonobacterales bacterium]
MARTALITGSSSGIGLATAQLFAQQGWNVAATSRDPSSLASLAGANIFTHQLDVTDAASIAAAVATTTDRFGSIDVLVNNAGYGLFGPLEGITPDQLEAQFQANLFGAVSMIRAVVPIMRQQHNGTIVNVSSTGGRIASPFAAAYHASKYALEGLSESLRYELKLQGIRVKLVEPGHVKSGFIRSLTWATHDAYEPQLQNYMGWVAQSDDHAPPVDGVAKVIVTAATDRSGRLRYLAKAGPLLTIHAMLPDGMWTAMAGAGLNRAPRKR